MAVTAYNYLDSNGVKTLAEELIKAANGRIKAAIVTTTDGADDDHALSVKALLALIGKKGDKETYPNSAFAEIQKLIEALGVDGDTSDKSTVYGKIEKTKEELEEKMNSLKHLSYEILEPGEITATMPETRKNGTIYFQHDDESDKTYQIYIWTGSDNSTGEYYVDSGSTPDAQEGDTEDKWLCVGDTSLDLVGYWKNTDDNVTALQQQILKAIDEATIKSIVQTAFDENAGVALTASVGP